jgi:hypothetical protein
MKGRSDQLKLPEKSERHPKAASTAKAFIKDSPTLSIYLTKLEP